MAIENKKQIILIIIAVVAGIASVVLMGNVIRQTVDEKTQALHDQYEAQQKQMQQELQRASEQQMAGLHDEINRMRQEQQAAIQQATDAVKAQQKAAMEAQLAKAAKPKRNSTLLTTKTPPGKRAVTVMIDSLNAVGGLLNAGDFVDVIAHLDLPQAGDDTKKKTVTAMVFQDLQVLAINTNLDDPGAYDEQQNAASLKVTFAVDPQEAGLLAFANKNGKLELALRASNESDKQTVKTSTWKTLADYVLQNQGESFDATADDDSSLSGAAKGEDSKPYIQIFRGGKEL